MDQVWEIVQHDAQVMAAIAGHALTEAARFLEGEDPVGKLTKDILIAIGITAFSSFVISGMIAVRESRRRANIRQPIRTFVVEAVSSAHNGIREAITNFNSVDGKHLKTRIKRLGDQLSKVRAMLTPSVLAGFGFFDDNQQKTIARYLAAIRLDDVTAVEQAVGWLRKIDRCLRDVMDACETSAFNAWDEPDLMAMREHLKRLEPSQRVPHERRQVDPEIEFANVAVSPPEENLSPPEGLDLNELAQATAR
jgi:hypothetical protein